MPTYRCFACGNDFEATPERGKPADAVDCHECGASGGQNVAPVLPVHYDPPRGKVRGRGKNHAACDESIRVGRPGHAFSGEAEAVTCAACKKTDAFQNAGDPSALEFEFKKIGQ